MNNGKYYTDSYLVGQTVKNDRIYGEKKDHIKICEYCQKEFIWHGRERTKMFKMARFCSRSCAANRSAWWKDNATHYRTIASHHHKKECAICGFDKIVAIHHIDEDNTNNNPKNLIPLCPNHHEMAHKGEWKHEVMPLIEKYQGGLV